MLERLYLLLTHIIMGALLASLFLGLAYALLRLLWRLFA